VETRRLGGVVVLVGIFRFDLGMFGRWMGFDLVGLGLNSRNTAAVWYEIISLHSRSVATPNSTRRKTNTALAEVWKGRTHAWIIEVIARRKMGIDICMLLLSFLPVEIHNVTELLGAVCGTWSAALTDKSDFCVSCSTLLPIRATTDTLEAQSRHKNF